MRASERFASEFRLGHVPARHATKVMQDRLGILVLMVDACQGISGAACRLPEFDTVLIARGEASGRRNFDLAHELFHVLTWHVMPPGRVENSRGFGGSRVEMLADKFAAALLMPEAVLGSFESCGDWSVECVIARLNAKADELEVTSSVLRWRLVGLRQLTRAKALAIPDAALLNNGGKDASIPPPLFSRPFVKVVASAIDNGQLSVRWAAQLVGLNFEDLEQLFSDHSVDRATDL